MSDPMENSKLMVRVSFPWQSNAAQAQVCQVFTLASDAERTKFFTAYNRIGALQMFRVDSTGGELFWLLPDGSEVPAL